MYNNKLKTTRTNELTTIPTQIANRSPGKSQILTRESQAKFALNQVKQGEENLKQKIETINSDIIYKVIVESPNCSVLYNKLLWFFKE